MNKLFTLQIETYSVYSEDGRQEILFQKVTSFRIMNEPLIDVLFLGKYAR